MMMLPPLDLCHPEEQALLYVQSNEPITLDDTDDEEGDAAAQALPAQRRSTRSNAYKGPADIFKVLLSIRHSRHSHLLRQTHRRLRAIPLRLHDLSQQCLTSPDHAAAARDGVSLLNMSWWNALVQGLKALYPEHGGPGAVEVVPADLVRLQPGEFLNDTIIDFYVRYSPFSMKLPKRDSFPHTFAP